jgi:hypothetical protein
LVGDFNLYVVVLTKDTRGKADGVYVNQAMANWQFNGSATIDPNVNFAWTAVGATGITAPAAWGGVAGAIQPKTTGARFNDVIDTAQWNLI